jgi:hypothetical protein
MMSVLQNKEEQITSAVILKMMSLMLVETNDFDKALKQCHIHFHKQYQEQSKKDFGVLITDYQISKIFAKHVCNITGFKGFLKSSINVNQLTELKSEAMPNTENKVLELNINKVNLRKDCFKAMKHYTDSGKTFEESLVKVTFQLNKSKQEEYGTVTVEMVAESVAHKCYATIQGMRKEPLKNILFLVKLLTAEEKAELKSKL